MRNCLNPLIGLGEEYGTTFLIVVHTNKRQGVYGRNRIADSADVWDIARSVLITGAAKDNMRYLSHEKSNYGEPGRTVLYTITESNRRRNNVRACRVVEINRERGLLCRLPWGTDEIWMKPRDFEVVPYKVGDWVDLVLVTISTHNHISVRSAQYIGKTPATFIPENN